MLHYDLPWNERAGNRVSSTYETYPDDDGNCIQIWREVFERGEMKLVIAEYPSWYWCGLTASSHANSEKSCGLGEISTVTFKKEPDLCCDQSIGVLIGKLDEKFGLTFQQVIDAARKHWLAGSPPPGTSTDAPCPKKEQGGQ